MLIAINLSPSIVSIWSEGQKFDILVSSENRVGTQENSETGDTVNIGALLPLSGVRASSGKSTEAALERAVEDVNDYFSRTNSSMRFNVVVQDTESDPAISLEKLKLLKENGIRIVIGPATSANVEAVKDYADKNDILILSHSSTAPSLAVAGDNLFRFVTNGIEPLRLLQRKCGIKA